MVSLFLFLKSEYEQDAFSLDILKDLRNNGSWSGELLTRRYSGELYSMLLTLSHFNENSMDNNLNIGVFHDISYKKQQEEELKWITQNDTLTGFSNRNFFLEILNSELKVAGRNSEVCAIMLLNIDGLKNINNIYGLLVGDKLIKEFSQRLKSCVREEDFVSRLGGDEFAILSPRFKSRFEVNSLIKRIRKGVVHPVIIDNKSIYLSISIGISLYPFDGSSHQDLIAKSSTALKRTKDYKKGSYSFYNSELDKTEMTNLEIELDLKNVIKFNELDLYFQPKVNPVNEKIEGFEALIRWNRYHKEWISPEVFIPISEENGQIIEIGYFVIEKCL